MAGCRKGRRVGKARARPATGLALHPLGRVLKVGGAAIPEGASHDARTGKQLPRLGIAGDRGVAHIHYGVLNIGVPSPVLHECHIGAGVESVHHNRMAQRLKLPSGLREICQRAIFLHPVPV
jgi:hypothetical protein